MLAEPDWDTLVLDSDDLATVRRVARLVADGAAHPDIGRRIARLATSHGLGVVSVECVSIAMPDYDTTDHIVRINDAIERAGDEIARTWWENVRHPAASGRFMALPTFVVLVARKLPRAAGTPD